MEDITYLATGLELNRYVYTIYRNWDNYKLDADIVVGKKSNKDNDDKPKNIEISK